MEETSALWPWLRLIIPPALPWPPAALCGHGPASVCVFLHIVLWAIDPDVETCSTAPLPLGM